MKKVLALIVLVVVVAAVWYMSSARSSSSSSTATSTSSGKGESASALPAPAQVGGPSTAKMASSAMVPDVGDVEDSEGYIDQEVRPAAEVYKSAEEALKAVKEGAAKYDDIILEQFVEPGEDCTWCPAFYSTIRDWLLAPDQKTDQKSFYGEILAISGQVENVSVLVDAVKNAKTPEEGEVYAESLELAVGKDDVVNYLAGQLSTSNQGLKESLVAAITNQGSRNAAEILYKHTTEAGNSDGYYTQGTGLGEFVPNEEALPFLQEIALKRDQYSHLAVKALLNGGLPGLQSVMELLANSKDAEFDRQMLKDAVEHVNYEQDTEDYLKRLVEKPSNPVQAEFGRKILDDFKSLAEEEESDAAEEPEEMNQSPVK